MALLLGCIADDFTGATDLANTLVKQGMKTVQVIGVPNENTDTGDAEAVVVALKSRTNPVAEAVVSSLAALDWLKSQGARQFFFKYCSTFDSTEQGNIGPVADALLDALGGQFSIACPAFPANGRTVYKGNLFVGDVLLSESGMRNHPLTPMQDSNLVRVLGRQTNGKVAMIDYDRVQRGAEAIKQSYLDLESAGHRYAIVDAISDQDLFAIGEASRNLPLITGGSGIALGLPDNFRKAGLIGDLAPADMPAIKGKRAVLAGSCSVATRGQVALSQKQWPNYEIDPFLLAEGKDVAAQVLDWAREQDGGQPLLISSSAGPEVVTRIQGELGREKAGEMVESAFGRIAQGLVEQGVRQLIVAGGETSGAVINALGIQGLRIGPEIDPGVPWCETLGDSNLAVALKSGNFGSEDFFLKAFEMLS